MEIYILIKITGEYSDTDWEVCSVYDNKKTALKDMYSLFGKNPAEYQIQVRQLNQCIQRGHNKDSIIADIYEFSRAHRLDNYDKIMDKVIEEIEELEESETFKKLLNYERCSKQLDGINSRKELFKQEYEKLYQDSELEQKTEYFKELFKGNEALVERALYGYKETLTKVVDKKVNELLVNMKLELARELALIV